MPIFGQLRAGYCKNIFILVDKWPASVIGTLSFCLPSRSSNSNWPTISWTKKYNLPHHHCGQSCKQPCKEENNNIHETSNIMISSQNILSIVSFMLHLENISNHLILHSDALLSCVIDTWLISLEHFSQTERDCQVYRLTTSSSFIVGDREKFKAKYM